MNRKILVFFFVAMFACLACAEEQEREDVVVVEDMEEEKDETEEDTEQEETDTTQMEIDTVFTFLALGDSYTIGESVAENERWPVQLADSLAGRGISVESPQIIARTGWRTDELAKSIEEQQPDKDFDMVSLLIGVNNQFQGRSVESYEPEFEELLKTAIEHAGGDTSKVFVVSIPDYGFTPFGQSNQKKISKELDDYNEANQRITEAYGIDYYYITDISRQGFEDPELVADDNLHPSGKQYAQWVGLILKDQKFLDRFTP